MYKVLYVSKTLYSRLTTLRVARRRGVLTIGLLADDLFCGFCEKETRSRLIVAHL